MQSVLWTVLSALLVGAASAVSPQSLGMCMDLQGPEIRATPSQSLGVCVDLQGPGVRATPPWFLSVCVDLQGPGVRATPSRFLSMCMDLQGPAEGYWLGPLQVLISIYGGLCLPSICGPPPAWLSVPVALLGVFWPQEEPWMWMWVLTPVGSDPEASAHHRGISSCLGGLPDHRGLLGFPLPSL